ncbi:hypothetical protein ED722_21645 [Escherichia coli]|nr:hypothetical protein [Escherichia coli]
MLSLILMSALLSPLSLQAADVRRPKNKQAPDGLLILEGISNWLKLHINTDVRLKLNLGDHYVD